jgi:type IV secretory pathway VirB3-like protein
MEETVKPLFTAKTKPLFIIGVTMMAVGTAILATQAAKQELPKLFHLIKK